MTKHGRLICIQIPSYDKRLGHNKIRQERQARALGREQAGAAPLPGLRHLILGCFVKCSHHRTIILLHQLHVVFTLRLPPILSQDLHSSIWLIIYFKSSPTLPDAVTDVGGGGCWFYCCALVSCWLLGSATSFLIHISIINLIWEDIRRKLFIIMDVFPYTPVEYPYLRFAAVENVMILHSCANTRVLVSII